MSISNFLVGLFIVSFPFQENLYFSGYSLSFILMALLIANVFFNHLGSLCFILKNSKIVRYSLFFLVGILIIEMLQPNTSFKGILRIFFILGGSIFLAASLQNSKGLVITSKMYLISGVLISINLIFFYSTLRGEYNLSFEEAELVRDQVSSQVTILQDFNNMAFNQGLSVLIAYSFLSFSKNKNKMYYAIIAIITFIGMVVTMSRGGLITVFGTVLALFFYFKIGGVKKFLLPVAFIFVMFILIPSTYYSRFNIDLRTDAAEKDGRARVFDAAINAIMQEGIFGVGEGNFWTEWGRKSEFARYGSDSGVIGTHNLFFQLLINWGILGLSLFSIILLKLNTLRPKRTDITVDSYLFFIIVVASVLYMAQIHNLHTKDFMIMFLVGIIREIQFKYANSIN